MRRLPGVPPAPPPGVSRGVTAMLWRRDGRRARLGRRLEHDGVVLVVVVDGGRLARRRAAADAALPPLLGARRRLDRHVLRDAPQRHAARAPARLEAHLVLVVLVVPVALVRRRELHALGAHRRHLGEHGGVDEHGGASIALAQIAGDVRILFKVRVDRESGRRVSRLRSSRRKRNFLLTVARTRCSASLDAAPTLSLSTRRSRNYAGCPAHLPAAPPPGRHDGVHAAARPAPKVQIPAGVAPGGAFVTSVPIRTAGLRPTRRAARSSIRRMSHPRNGSSCRAAPTSTPSAGRARGTSSGGARGRRAPPPTA